jgi:hypothetical protein
LSVLTATSTTTSNTTPLAVPPTVVEGDDGRIELKGNQLVLTFADKRFGNPLKKAIGVRVYPLAAVADLCVQAKRHHGHPVLQIVVRPGCDLLRPLLKNPAPGPDADPDILILPKGSTVIAESFASHVCSLLGSAGDGTEPLVDSGKPPLSAKGVDNRAVFDGETITLDTRGSTASSARKAAYPRHIPVGAVADVVLDPPGMKGRLRFVLAGGPDREAPINPSTDLDTVELTADSGQCYAVLAAAVLTAARRTGVSVHPDLLSLPADESTPSMKVSLTSDVPDDDAFVEQQATASSPVVPATIDPTVADQATQQASAEPATMVSTAPTRTVVPQPSWLERRAEKRAVKEHEKAVASWQTDQDLLDRLATVSRAAVDGGGGAAAGILLKSGESLLWDGVARLVEIHRESGHYQGGYSGVSFRIAKGVRYSVGGTRGHYVPGPEVQTPVDAGRVVVTTQRVLFTGGKTTREWNHAKFISIDTSSDDSVVMIHVSNRQKVSGLSLGKAGTEFTTFLSLGITIAQHGAEAVAEDCEQTAASHRNERP